MVTVMGLYSEPILPYELYHSGIKGQRWGVRRYQNSDRTWTDEGKDRYRWGSDKSHSVNPESADGKTLNGDDINKRIASRMVTEVAAPMAFKLVTKKAASGLWNSSVANNGKAWLDLKIKNSRFGDKYTKLSNLMSSPFVKKGAKFVGYAAAAVVAYNTAKKTYNIVQEEKKKK